MRGATDVQPVRDIWVFFPRKTGREWAGTACCLCFAVDEDRLGVFVILSLRGGGVGGVGFLLHFVL